MKAVPWLLTAIAIGVAAALYVENRETERQRDALDRQLDALNRQVERARAASLALEKAHANERAAAEALMKAVQAEMAARAAAVAAQGAEKASRAAQKQAEAASRAAERVAAEKDLADRLATEKAALEAQREQIAMEKARAEKLAAEARAAAEPARQPKVTYLTSSEARKKAMDLETEGRGHEAVRIYIAAARSGDCEAAAGLGEIYDKGLVGVARDYAESLKWQNAARVLGCNVPLSPRS